MGFCSNPTRKRGISLISSLTRRVTIKRESEREATVLPFGASYRMRAAGCARARRGSTLIELLVVISLATMMMGTVSVFLRIMFQSSTGTRNDANMQTSIARLSDTFRADVHRAEEAMTQGNSLQLRTFSGMTVRYQSTEHGVKRDETAADGRTLRRDRFWLPVTWEVRWDADTAPPRRLVGLTIEPSAASRGAGASAFGPLAIRAALAGPTIRSMEPGDSVRPEGTDENRSD